MEENMVQTNNEQLENKEPEVDIDALLSKAREQEKQKLYPEIEKLKNELKAKNAKLNESILKVSSLEDKVAEKDKEISKINELVEKAKEEGKGMGEEQIKLLEKERDDYKARAEKAEAEFLAFKEAQELETYKNSKIKDLDEDFRELVVGGSKEEIDSSFEKAKALADKIKDKYKPNVLPTPTLTLGIKNTKDLEGVREMSNDEYEKLRKSFFGSMNSHR